MQKALLSCLLSLLCLATWPAVAVAQTVYHVKIHTDDGMIDPGFAAFVERAIQDAEVAGASAIVFDIDTFGGRVDAATVIRDAIFDTDILTVAFVNKRAISAGALISLACDKIVMTSGASIGAATAVSGATGEKASDKVISYFRAEMRATAERTGRDPKLVEAMVDERVEIPGLSEEAGRPATLTTEQALAYDLADETAETLYSILKIYDLEDAEIVKVGTNWSERLLSLLTHPAVTSILLAVAMFGLIAEVRTPGWGLGGTLALVALGLFFGSHYLVRLAEFRELLLIVVGLGLLAVEIFVIPGFGIAGIAGIVAMVAGLVLSQLPVFEAIEIGAVSGAVMRLAVGLIGAIVMSMVFMRALPLFSTFNRLVLQTDTAAGDGYVSADTGQDTELVGQEGTTLTELRPVGVGLFDGQRLDVITEGEFVGSQRAVKIIKARGSRIVVRPV
jgi:membrane-bound serine protease (ClpP class)